MRTEESARLRDILAFDVLGGVSAVIELGSSTRSFREQNQPHILANIHDPLVARGVRVVTSDLKGGDGIDVSGDLYDASVQARLREVGADLVMVCNILEHVAQRADFARICDSLIRPGGYLLVSVPYSYPFHPDPIDTLFRPAPGQIAALFPGYRLLHGEIVTAGSFRGDMKRSGTSVPVHLIRTIVRSLWPWKGWTQFRARWHRWLWIARPYKVSLALLEKP